MLQDTIIFMRRPVIGITSDFSDGYNEKYPELLTYRLKSSYVNAVIKAGGTPLIIPFEKDAEAATVLSRIDGLIISGSGDDIHPYFTGLAKRPPAKNYIKRQNFEFRLTSEAIEREIPDLGICGGMQILNVFFGGNLIEDIPSRINSNIHMNEYFRIAHRIKIERGTHLFKAVQRTALSVNSTHHQAVYFIPYCFRISAMAPDGVIEGIELDSDNTVIGVQYHPEAMINRRIHLKLFEYFIKKARSR